MSTSSNKSQKKGEDGMGKAGKRHEMVKGTYERRACERVACMSVCVYVPAQTIMERDGLRLVYGEIRWLCIYVCYVMWRS